jgi:hypothetical protein
VYDMYYYWDRPGRDALNGAKRSSRPVRGTRHPRRPAQGAHPAAAAQAVQVALDRRDNGGDSSVRRDQ